ncbi:MAG: class I SAM-dependent methyltransferase [Pirellulales bacterium]|nr:class I SAM-dependent methyltransferase [Pirellulales bacterium]
MVKNRDGKLYDHPKYYDVVFGNDWRSEFRFLQECFREHVSGRSQRLFEPACGTGRLLHRFSKAGYQVWGLDLNPHAVRYCNARQRRHQLPETAAVGDMSDFSLVDFGIRRPFDAAFNTINSFRHLDSEAAARGHLRCVANAVRSGGIYVLGFHLTPAHDPFCVEESWEASRGTLTVATRMRTTDINRRTRQEMVEMLVDVRTPAQHNTFQEEMVFRTYSADQARALLRSVPEWNVVSTYDFAYDFDNPMKVDGATEDVVFVLRRE